MKPMYGQDVLVRGLAGAAAGAAGTVAMLPLHMGVERWLPALTAPIRKDPGEFMLEQIAQRFPGHMVIPDAVARPAAQGLALGYGVAFGVLGGVLIGRPRDIVVPGVALGLAAWAAGYLGWLPAAGLMPPVTQQRPEQVATPIVEHVVYGIVAAAVLCHLLRS